MLNITADNREIKSFRLRYKIKDLKSFFSKETSEGVFVFSDSLKPKDRAILREQLSLRQLQINFYSKTLFQFLLKDSKYNNLKNLLQGDVFLIKKIDSTQLSQSDLNFILSQTNLLVRFLFLNQSVYNIEDIKKLILGLNQKKDIKEIPIMMANII